MIFPENRYPLFGIMLVALLLRCDARDVTHLAARPHARLAVEMNRGARHIEPLAIFLHLGADEVDHLDPAAAHRRRQGPAGDRAHVLLALRDGGAAHRSEEN